MCFVLLSCTHADEPAAAGEEEEDEAAPAGKPKGKKDKKGKKDMNSLFAALEEDGAAGGQSS